MGNLFSCIRNHDKPRRRGRAPKKKTLPIKSISVPPEMNVSFSTTSLSDLSSFMMTSTATGSTTNCFRTSTLSLMSSSHVGNIFTADQQHVAELRSHSPRPIDQEENKMDLSEAEQIPEGEMCQYDLKQMGLQEWHSISNHSIPTESLHRGSLHISLPLHPINQKQDDTHNLNRSGVHQNRGSKYESRYSQNPNKVYKMDTGPRGLVLIINNVNFQNFNDRIGSDKDQEKICQMFKYLGFHHLVEIDLTAQEMRKSLEDFAKMEQLKSVSALAVVILTHGAKHDCLFGIDGKYQDGAPVPGTFINKIDLYQYFTRRNCPSMAGKPKLFILQACRGHLEDELPNKNGNEFTFDCNVNSIAADGDFRLKANSIEARSRTADISDMCFVYSSSPGYKAYRGRSDGSPFMTLFCERVQLYADRKEFRDIIQKARDYFVYEL